MKLPWRQKDTHGNGRVLFVDRPSRGEIPMGISGVYTKHLTPKEARKLARVLLAAADIADGCRPLSPLTAAPPLTSGVVCVPPAWLADRSGV